MEEEQSTKEMEEQQRRMSISKRVNVYQKERKKSEVYMLQHHKKNRETALKHLEEASEFFNRIEAKKEREIKKWRLNLKSFEERERLLEYCRQKEIYDENKGKLRRRHDKSRKSIWDIDNVLLKHIVHEMSNDERRELQSYGIIEEETEEELENSVASEPSAPLAKVEESERTSNIGLTGHHRSFITFGDIHADETIDVYCDKRHSVYQPATGMTLDIPGLVIEHTKSAHEHLPVVDSNYDKFEAVGKSPENVIDGTEVDTHSSYEILVIPSRPSSMDVQIDSSTASKVTLIHLINQEPVFVSSADIASSGIDNEQIIVTAKQLVHDSLRNAVLQLGHAEDKIIEHIGLQNLLVEQHDDETSLVVSESIVQSSKKIAEMSLTAAAVALGYEKTEVSKVLGVDDGKLNQEEQVDSFESMNTLNELYNNTVGDMAVLAMKEAALQLGYTEDQAKIAIQEAQESLNQLEVPKRSLSCLASGIAKTAIMNASVKLELESSAFVTSLIEDVEKRTSSTNMTRSNYSLLNSKEQSGELVVLTHNALRNVALTLGYSEKEVDTIIGKEKFCSRNDESNPVKPICLMERLSSQNVLNQSLLMRVEGNSYEECIRNASSLLTANAITDSIAIIKDEHQASDAQLKIIAQSLVEKVIEGAINIVSKDLWDEKDAIEAQKELKAFALKFSMVVIGSAGKRLGYTDESILKALSKDLSKPISGKDLERHPNALVKFNKENIAKTMQETLQIQGRRFSVKDRILTSQTNATEFYKKRSRRLTPFFPESVQKKLVKEFNVNQKHSKVFDVLDEEEENDDGDVDEDEDERNQKHWSLNFIKKIESIEFPAIKDTILESEEEDIPNTQCCTEEKFNIADTSGNGIQRELSEYPTEEEFISLAQRQNRAASSKENALLNLLGHNELAPGILDLYNSIQSDVVKLLSNTNMVMLTSHKPTLSSQTTLTSDPQQLLGQTRSSQPFSNSSQFHHSQQASFINTQQNGSSISQQQFSNSSQGFCSAKVSSLVIQQQPLYSSNQTHGQRTPVAKSSLVKIKASNIEDQVNKKPDAEPDLVINVKRETPQSSVLPDLDHGSQVCLTSSMSSMKNAKVASPKVSNAVVDLPPLPRSPHSSKLSVNRLPSPSQMKTPSLPTLSKEKSRSIIAVQEEMQPSLPKVQSRVDVLKKDDCMQNEEPEIVLKSPKDFEKSLCQLDGSSQDKIDSAKQSYKKQEVSIKDSKSKLPESKGKNSTTNVYPQRLSEEKSLDNKTTRRTSDQAQPKQSELKSNSKNSLDRSSRSSTPNYAKPLKRSTEVVVAQSIPNVKKNSIVNNDRKQSEDLQSVFERLSTTTARKKSIAAEDASPSLSSTFKVQFNTQQSRVSVSNSLQNNQKTSFAPRKSDITSKTSFIQKSTAVNNELAQSTQPSSERFVRPFESSSSVKQATTESADKNKVIPSKSSQLRKQSQSNHTTQNIQSTGKIAVDRHVSKAKKSLVMTDEEIDVKKKRSVTTEKSISTMTKHKSSSIVASVPSVKSSTSSRKKKKSKSKVSISKSHQKHPPLTSKPDLIESTLSKETSSLQISGQLKEKTESALSETPEKSYSSSNARDLVVTEMDDKQNHMDAAKEEIVSVENTLPTEKSDVILAEHAPTENNGVEGTDKTATLESQVDDESREPLGNESTDVSGDVEEQKSTSSMNNSTLIEVAMSKRGLTDIPENECMDTTTEAPQQKESLPSTERLSRPQKSSFVEIQPKDTNASVVSNIAKVSLTFDNSSMSEKKLASTSEKEFPQIVLNTSSKHGNNGTATSTSTINNIESTSVVSSTHHTTADLKFVPSPPSSHKLSNLALSQSARHFMNNRSPVSKSKSVGSPRIRSTDARYRNYSTSTFRETIPSVFDMDYTQSVAKPPSINDVINKRSKTTSTVWVPSESIAKKTSVTGENLHSPSAVLAKSPSKQISSSSFKSGQIFVTPAASINFNLGSPATTITEITNNATLSNATRTHNKAENQLTGSQLS